MRRPSKRSSARPDRAGRRGDGAGLLRIGRVLALIGVGLAAALGLAVLRTDLLRMRYALPDILEQEQHLRDEQRSLTARMRQLRDPVHLAERARELGFVRPARLIDLPASESPALADPSTALAAAGAASAPAPLDRP